jgi:hypothetical protein
MPDCWPIAKSTTHLGLSTMEGEILADARTVKSERHALVGLLPQPTGRVGPNARQNDQSFNHHSDHPR